MELEYELVLWPEVQELMEYPWFRKECYLMQGVEDQAHFDSSYFVPKKRLWEVEEAIRGMNDACE